MSLPAKKLSVRVGKKRDGYADTENTNYYSQGAYSFPGFKYLLTLEIVQEPYQLTGILKENDCSLHT